MKKDYFIIVLAHSLHGRLQRIHISHRFLYGAFAAFAIAVLLAFGCAGSYARMALKVANYDSLQREAELLRARYRKLQRTANQTSEQLASLQLLADEVSAAYGVKKRITGSPDLVSESPLLPTMRETLEEYDFLRSSNFSRQRSIFVRQNANILPSIWPLTGRLMDGYGNRNDPFSGEGAMHSGIDISAPKGTPVHVAADGVVIHAARNMGYGRLIVVDHGNNYQTYYAHLSRIDVMEGEEVRRGEVVGAVGTTGRSTGPHLHYEVRIGGTPVNPYRFLARASVLQAASVQSESDFPF